MDQEFPGKAHRIPAHVEYQYKRHESPTELENFALRVLKGLSRNALAQGYGLLRSTRRITLSTSPVEIARHTGEYDRGILIFNDDTVGNNTVLVSQNPTVTNGLPILPGRERFFMLVRNMELHAKADTNNPTIVVAEYTELPL